MTRRVVEKLSTKKVCVHFLAPTVVESFFSSLSWIALFVSFLFLKVPTYKSISDHNNLEVFKIPFEGFSEEIVHWSRNQGKTKGQQLKGKIVS